MSLGVSSPDGSPDIASVVAALDDADCRAIVATLEDPLTARELSDRTDLPLSTTYRKLDRLREADLVTETVGVHSRNRQESRYVADLERVSISLTDDREFAVDLERSKTGSVGLWSELRREL
ncbi:winged helix-turn-helix domain-containing protein [Halobiforma nitratireducens]|uniref:ArsR family transcriptional regulator n=1 Tax=Halobiforma nitratireducens JCM 10879 TaxID=1227454 RepID=M0M2V7_9EURY|nr:helix-turn-helix domain-containing protein [Halobiforma nitratireducens]EMA38740.1 hypothetical protein C446_09468 [Halobiforma nitratireducens JCM 10879]